jgi:hypothetical protein
MLASTLFAASIALLGLALINLAPEYTWLQPWFFLFAALCFVASALVFFWWRPRLEVRYSQALLAHGAHGEHYFRISIYNRGPVCAENVKVRLLDTTRQNRGRNKFPYRVVRDGAEWGGDLQDFIEISDVSINPHAEELFMPISAHNLENNFILHKIDTESKGGRYPWTIAPGEKFELNYKVESATASSIEFRLSVCNQDGFLIVMKMA